MPKKYTHSERISRFWSRVQIRGFLDCWIWTGSRNPKGYGQVGIGNGKVTRTHRFAWEITYGPIPEGLHCLHKCDNPSCCNPNHLSLGSNIDNMRDRDKRKRGRQAVLKGIANGMAKLTDDDVREIRQLLASGRTQKTVGEQFGVDRTVVGKIKNGRIWTHIT